MYWTRASTLARLSRTSSCMSHPWGRQVGGPALSRRYARAHSTLCAHARLGDTLYCECVDSSGSPPLPSFDGRVHTCRVARLSTRAFLLIRIAAACPVDEVGCSCGEFSIIAIRVLSRWDAIRVLVDLRSLQMETRNRRRLL